jgi:hypothetical protein
MTTESLTIGANEGSISPLTRDNRRIGSEPKTRGPPPRVRAEDGPRAHFNTHKSNYHVEYGGDR